MIVGELSKVEEIMASQAREVIASDFVESRGVLELLMPRPPKPYNVLHIQDWEPIRIAVRGARLVIGV